MNAKINKFVVDNKSLHEFMPIYGNPDPDSAVPMKPYRPYFIQIVREAGRI